MKNKYWTIEVLDMEGKSHYVHVIAMSITKAVAWVCEHQKCSAEQIVWAKGEEAEQV